MRRLALLTVALGLVALGAVLAAPAAETVTPLRPLATGFYLGQRDADTPPAYARAQANGTTVTRIPVSWAQVAPSALRATFDATDPSDKSYRWSWLDQQVKAAAAAGLTPILTVYDAPVWAQGAHAGSGSTGNWKVDVARFGEFAQAIATRYGGGFLGLPRVSDWEVWNEPNVNSYLGPEVIGGRPWAPERYRQLVNAFAEAVHAVHRDNVVAAGGLSPFTVDQGDTLTIGPLKFMARMLCMSLGSHPRPTCSRRVEFDVWSHHPYTSGGPFHKAYNPDDVSLGDLPKMRALLLAAYKAHHIMSAGPPGFWVTEFSWDSNPPDPNAVPLALHARWTAEALYQMWRNGVSLVIWLQLKDYPYPATSFQSGLYFRNGQPKPALTAFRFPFVAYLRGGGVYVWGRTPWGRTGSVVVQLKHPEGSWRTVQTLGSDRYGIFSQTLAVSATAKDFMRVRLASGTRTSLAFSLTQPPDRSYRPFG